MNLNKLKFALVFFSVLGLTACKDDETKNLVSLEEYFETNNISAQNHSSGLKYTIEEEGIGVKPSASSRVTVFYKGFFTNGNEFDSSRGKEVSFGLNEVIQGWTIGFPLLKKGSKATLYIPSHLGYGARGRGSIPPNADLIFEVELIDFK
ncbi:MAG: FKBP-type peptidyl-prolyl cis-trans isomerase [Flammeovirgaceae bacterium]|jgi:FKBP-type peptidyl-prolyl cis-trans isomerase FkpA